MNLLWWVKISGLHFYFSELYHSKQTTHTHTNTFFPLFCPSLIGKLAPKWENPCRLNMLPAINQSTHTSSPIFYDYLSTSFRQYHWLSDDAVNPHDPLQLNGIFALENFLSCEIYPVPPLRFRLISIKLCNSFFFAFLIKSSSPSCW